MSIISLLVNKVFSDGDNKRDENLSTPNNIVCYDDIVYGSDTKNNVLDVYRPKDNNEILPVIVSVHGGGWVYGNKQRYQYYCMDLALRGFVVINFTYRLAPKHKFPKQLEDVCKVFEWLIENKEKYNYDLNRLYAVGDSAGAHLLTLYCNLYTNSKYAYNFNFKAPILPRAIALNCGVYDVYPEKGIIKYLIKDFVSKDKLDLINPLKHMNNRFPKAYVMTAIQDMLKNDSILLIKRLAELKIENEYHLYDNDTHDLAHVFHLIIRSSDAIKCNDDECEFFKRN